MTNVRKRGATALTWWLEERSWTVRTTRRDRVDDLEAWKDAQRRQLRWSTRTSGDLRTGTRFRSCDEDA